MASTDAEKEKLRIAREAQGIFKDAIEFIMAGDLPKLKSLFANYLEKNPTLTSNDIVVGFVSEGRNLLHIAASSGHIFIVEYIIKCTTNIKEIINVKDDRGFSPLLNAVVSESNEVVSLLLSLGGDVNAQNNDGAAAVHFAACDGSIARLELLCKFNAKLDVQSKSGAPIHWAAGKGRSEAIKYLISKNVDVNLISNEGLPPVIMAAVASCDLGVKYLVEAGADIGLILSGNLTTLHICAEHGLLEAVKSILTTSNGKNCCNIATNDGNTPLQLAAMSGHRQIVEVLLPYTDLSMNCIVDTKNNDNVILLQKYQQNPAEYVHQLVDYLIEDGKRRLSEWEMKHKQPENNDNNNNNETIFNKPRESITNDVITQAEQQKDTGNKYFKSKDYNEAIKYYSLAIEYNPYNEIYYSNRSASYLALQQYNLALKDAEICRRLNPTWAKGCYRLAEARLALGQYEDAAVAAFEGCKLDESNHDLKKLMQLAVKKGQEEHKRKLDGNK